MPIHDSIGNTESAKSKAVQEAARYCLESELIRHKGMLEVPNSDDISVFDGITMVPWNDDARNSVKDEIARIEELLEEMPSG